MINYKDWLIKAKADNPDKVEFITKLEDYITDAGLNYNNFDKAVELRLKKIESDINLTFKPVTNAQN